MEKLLTSKEVANLLQITTRSVFNLRKEQKLPAVRIGALIRFKEYDVEKFLQGKKES